MEATSSHNKYFSSIDLVKVVMAVLVVAVHTRPELCIQNDSVQLVLSRIYGLAVPFFFVTSGFLLWNKVAVSTNEEKIARVTVWLKRILLLYVLWTLIYLPYAIYGFIHDEVGFTSALIVYFRNFLLVGENFWSWQLWYLLALVVSGCLIWGCLKCGLGVKGMVIVAGSLLMVGLVISESHDTEISKLYFRVFKTLRNGFFEGFPYMVIGIIVANSKRLPMWLLAIILICSMTMYMNGMKISLFFVLWSMFSLLLQTDISISYETSSVLRFSSKVIYLIHMLWFGLLSVTLHIESFALFSSVLFLSAVSAILLILERNNEIVKLLFV